MKKMPILRFAPMLLAISLLFAAPPLLSAKPPISVDHNSFRQKVLNSDRLVVVEFWAPWCSACRSFDSTFSQLASTHSKVVFAKVNSDQNPTLASWYKVRSLPTVLLVKNGRVVKSFRGAPKKAELDQAIQANS